MSYLRNPELKAARELDFERFSGVFGKTGIRPSDIDYFVERNGHFLVIEGKGRSLSLSSGQRRALLRLSEVPSFTVLIIGGDDPNEPTIMQRFADGSAMPSRTCTKRDVLAFIAMWFAEAETASQPINRTSRSGRST